MLILHPLEGSLFQPRWLKFLWNFFPWIFFFVFSYQLMIWNFFPHSSSMAFLTSCLFAHFLEVNMLVDSNFTVIMVPCNPPFGGSACVFEEKQVSLQICFPETSYWQQPSLANCFVIGNVRSYLHKAMRQSLAYVNVLKLLDWLFM